MKKIFLSIITVASVLLISSCDDFLDIKSNNIITGGGLAEENIQALTAPLYNKVWYNFNDKSSYGFGDGMSYNLRGDYSDYIYPFADFSYTGLTGALVGAWGSFYNVIQQANKVIITINSMDANAATKTKYIAEARFMRGVAYWYLASLWGDAIITEDPTPLVNNPIVNANRKRDVYEFAIRDLEFAAKCLPETSAETGRVNQYSAFGMLSRFYLDYSGYVASNYGENPNCQTRDAAYLELAKKAAEKVIGNPAFKLMGNYADLFTPEYNNNSESLFAFQWVGGVDVSDAFYGVTNSQIAYFACSTVITGNDAAYGGGGTICTYDMIKEYEPDDLIRRKATWMGEGDYYPEINKANGGLRLGTGEGDLDRNKGNGNQYLSVKKGVTGSHKDNPAIGRQNSGLDNPLLRLAEVYLNYAEAILGNDGSTSNTIALEYFNKVRTRSMPNSPKTSITWEDLRHERRVEFCMEGRYWYDLLARSYYRQQEVINYLNGQDRGNRPPYLFDAPNNLRLDPERNVSTRAVGTATAATFRLPYPESETIQNPKLNEAPVAYNFTEEKITDLFN